MNIVVLAGGLSTERNVSLSSGAMVLEALKNSGHRAVLIDSYLGTEQVPQNIYDLFTDVKETNNITVSQEIPNVDEIRKSRKDYKTGDIGPNVIDICRAADIVYMGLHGEDGENGRMQAFFDILNIKYTGDGYFESAIAMNKTVTKQLVQNAGVRVPKGKSFFAGQDFTTAKEIGFPMIVKPCSGGSSIGVTIVNDEKERQKAFLSAFEYEDEVVAEEYVEGREFSVGVLGDMVLPPIEIIPNEGFYDYAHKYQAGWTKEVCPADLTANQESKMKELTKRAFDALRLCVYGRGEFIMDKNGEMFFLEMNTLPGMTPTSLLPQEAQAVGISYEQLCNRVIDLSLAKYKG